MNDDHEWYEIHDNLALTARWMADNGYKADDLAYFVEKPHKYENEFKQAQAAYEAELVEQNAEARAYANG